MRRPRRQPAGICFVVCASLAWAAAARAAAADPSKPFSRVTLDINSGGIEETLPFDIPFYFSGTVDQNVKRFDIAVLERAQGSSSPSCAPGTSIANLKWQHREGSGLDFLVFEPRPLKANRMYCVNLTIIRSVSAEKVKTA